MNHDPALPDPEPTGFWRSRHAFGFLVLAAVAAYFLLSEHRAHFFAGLPFLLLMYARLAITEETEMGKRFGAEVDARAAHTPRFLPSWRSQPSAV